MMAGACGWDDGVDSLSATEGLPSTRADVEARDWVLDGARSSPRTDAGSPVTLSVAGDEISGQAPCNIYRGSVDLGRDGLVEVSDVAVTQMACEQAAMDAETAFLAALEGADHAKVHVDKEGRDDRDTLVLSGPDDVRLVFRSYDAADLLAGRWTVHGINTGDAISSVIIGTEPTITFGDEGDLQVATGCNDGRGDWELDGHEITIGPIAATRKACTDPEGVMDQE